MLYFKINLEVPSVLTVDRIMWAYENAVIKLMTPDVTGIRKMRINELLSEIMHEHIETRLDHPNITTTTISIEDMAECLTLLIGDRLSAELMVATLFVNKGTM